MIENAIIGGGLSGTILAWQFYFKEIPFKLFDDKPQNSSSKIAAGLYNPIVFKRLTLSWQSDKLIPYLDDFYNNIENTLGVKFHFKRKLLRILPSKDEKDLWDKKSREFPEFLQNEIESNKYSDFIDAPFGLGIVKEAGNIDTNLFLDKSHIFFKSINSFEQRKIEENNFQDLSKNVFFAEGWLNINNPFFSWLPYKLVKGEILRIKIEGFDIWDVPTKRIFLLPLGNDEFIAGSTYRWEFKNDKPTIGEKKFLLDKLYGYLKAPYEILEHKAGIRPAVLDRRPLIGEHPNMKGKFLFNGMGSKSVMLAPFLSDMLVESIFKQKEIHSEVNLARYLKYFK